MKPDIVFFGEQLPERFHDCVKNDKERADLVLVMGSSLEVAPVKCLPGILPQEAPAVLLNREVVGRPSIFDVELLGRDECCRSVVI